MDNLGKALHIGVGALLFIIALTSSVILYGKVMDYVEVGLRVSDDGRRAETSDDIYGIEERTITHSEVLMALVKIHSTNANTIKVSDKNGNTKTYTILSGTNKLTEDLVKIDSALEATNINTHKFQVDNGVYAYSYSEGTKTITYKWEGDL